MEFCGKDKPFTSGTTGTFPLKQSLIVLMLNLTALARCACSAATTQACGNESVWTNLTSEFEMYCNMAGFL